MAAGAPAGEIRAIDEENKRQKKMEQNKEIKKYRRTCPKCDLSSFTIYYQLANEELNEHLKCSCSICGYIWHMEPKEKEN